MGSLKMLPKLFGWQRPGKNALGDYRTESLRTSFHKPLIRIKPFPDDLLFAPCAMLRIQVLSCGRFRLIAARLASGYCCYGTDVLQFQNLIVIQTNRPWRIH
jgi:hypothetical protein